LTWDFLSSPENDINNLFNKVKNIEFDDILAFQEADVTDNNMPYREILEDSSKIFYLHEQIKQDNLIFNPQIIHEPWHSRYRIHPGSGRLAAFWLANKKTVTCLYTHFDVPGFKVPPNSIKLKNVGQVIKSMTVHADASDCDIGIDTYQAFPTSIKDQKYTLEKDSEWHYNIHATTKNWQFLRYSEGDNFLQYKRDWRTNIIELWEYLQNK
jgi:hypothetical protein